MFSDSDESSFNPSVRLIEFSKNGTNCGFSLTRGKWDPYPWVSCVDQKSISSAAGLKIGDCLLEVNGVDIIGRKICDIAKLVKSQPEKISLLVWNAGVDPHCSSEALCCGSLPSNLSRLSACLTSILAFLECPICLDTITPPTYQCENGHLICIKCRSKSERCPVCRVKLATGRSLISDQVYNAVVEAFNLKEESSEIRAKKISLFFKSKTTSKKVPYVKVTQCHTNRFLAKIIGKSTSVENLFSNSLLDPASNENLKAKSLSSDEIFHTETPTKAGVGPMMQQMIVAYRNCNTKMNSSLNSYSDFKGNKSYHGSYEFLGYSENAVRLGNGSQDGSERDRPTFYCPFDSKCSITIEGTSILEHFQTCHTGPFIQYFDQSFKQSLGTLDNEVCNIMNINGFHTFFLKIINSIDQSEPDKKLQKNILVWCWYLGNEAESSNFKVELDLFTNKTCETLLLRLTGPVFSLKSMSYRSILKGKKGIYLSGHTLKALQPLDKLILAVNIIVP